MSKRELIWDIPVRVLHWTLAAATSAALVFAFVHGPDHPWFGYHAWAGMVAAGALVLRIVWGFVGPGSARFSRWPWSPLAVLRFVLGLFGLGKGAHEQAAGHNPLASWVMLSIFLVTGALVASGLAGGEDPHETLAIVLASLIGVHLAGLLWHTIRHRENIARAMLDGRKRVTNPDGKLRHASRLVGVVVALILAIWIVLLVRGYDHAEGTLRLPGFKQPIILTDGAGVEDE